MDIMNVSIILQVYGYGDVVTAISNMFNVFG